MGECRDIYAHYACVADCADAMADAWEDSAGCAHADFVRGNVLNVMTQSQPGPKGPVPLYVHTQETVDHTLLSR